jgi:hypothetical protein
MNRRDRELLNKQFRWLTPKSQNYGLFILAVVGVFFAGIALGSAYSANDNKPVPVSPKIALVGSFSVR